MDTEMARETARLRDGRFGSQPRGEAAVGLVGIPEPVDVDRVSLAILLSLGFESKPVEVDLNTVDIDWSRPQTEIDAALARLEPTQQHRAASEQANELAGGGCTDGGRPRSDDSKQCCGRVLLP